MPDVKLKRKRMTATVTTSGMRTTRPDVMRALK
jgi:hypothetical protein